MVALPDGRLACGDCDGAIRVWDTHACTPPRDGDAAIRRRAAACAVIGHVALEGHGWGVTAISLLPDGRLASDCLRVWRYQPNHLGAAARCWSFSLIRCAHCIHFNGHATHDNKLTTTTHCHYLQLPAPPAAATAASAG